MKKLLLIVSIVILLFLSVSCVSSGGTQGQAVSTPLQQLQTQVATLQATVTTLQQRISDVENKKASTSDIQNISASATSAKANADNALSKANSIESSVNTVKTMADGLNTRITALETWKNTFTSSTTGTTGGSTSGGSTSTGQVLVDLLPNYANQIIVADGSTAFTYVMNVTNNTNQLQWVKIDCDFTPRDGVGKEVNPANTTITRADVSQTIVASYSYTGTNGSNYTNCTDIFGRSQVFTIQRGQVYTFILTVKIAANSSIWDADFEARWKDISW